MRLAYPPERGSVCVVRRSRACSLKICSGEDWARLKAEARMPIHGGAVRACQTRSKPVKPLGRFKVQGSRFKETEWLEIWLALILTFSPWEKEQQGLRWGVLDELAGAASQTRSKPVKPLGRFKETEWLEIWLALILAFSPGRRNSRGSAVGAERVGWDGQPDSVKAGQTIGAVQSSKFKVQGSKRPNGWRFGSPSPFPLPLERVSDGAAPEGAGRVGWDGQSDSVKAGQTIGAVQSSRFKVQRDRMVGDLARPHPDLLPRGEGTAGAALGGAGRVASDGQSGSVKAGQTIGAVQGDRMVGDLARPHPDLLPRGEGTAGAALGVLDELPGPASQARSKPVKPLGRFKETEWLEMWLALILTFSPGEKEQQGLRWECWTSWLGRPVRLGQSRSNHWDSSKFEVQRNRMVGDVARPHPDLLPRGEGTAGAALGGAGRVASDGQSGSVKAGQTNWGGFGWTVLQP